MPVASERRARWHVVCNDIGDEPVIGGLNAVKPGMALCQAVPAPGMGVALTAEETRMACRILSCFALFAAVGCFTGSGNPVGDGSGSSANGAAGASPSAGMGPSGGAAGSGSGVSPPNSIGTAGAGSQPPARSTDVASACTLSRDSGPCEAAIPRYYFDSASGLCLMFNYGGCDGNENNFASLDACKTACFAAFDPSTAPVCPSFAEYCKRECAGEMVVTSGPSCPLPKCDCGAFASATDGGKADLCASGVPLDVAMCEGTIADKLCFADAKDACACLGCADTCELLESWPQIARCP